MNDYIVINNGMLLTFVERWYSEMSFFHRSHGEMSITLDDVSSFLHLLIRDKLLDHSKMTTPDALEMIVTYLGANQEDDLKELEDTIGCHARFEFLEKLYLYNMVAAVEANGDDAQINRAYA